MSGSFEVDSSRPIMFVVLVLCLSLFSTYALLSKSPGSLDDITHYLISRYSWAHPQLFVDIWGRPAYTILASPFAQFGIRAAGFFNILVSLLACYVAFALAKFLNFKQPWLASVFTAIQPFFLLLSFSTLTEPLFGLLLATATLLYFRGCFLRSALCVSLLPLARLEGFAFVIFWLILFARRGELKAAMCLFLFPALWNLGGFVVTAEPLFLWRYNPYYTGGYFGYGSWMHYLSLWPNITGPILLSLITVGMVYGAARQGNLVHALTGFFLDSRLWRIKLATARRDMSAFL